MVPLSPQRYVSFSKHVLLQFRFDGLPGLRLLGVDSSLDHIAPSSRLACATQLVVLEEVLVATKSTLRDRAGDDSVHPGKGREQCMLECL